MNIGNTFNFKAFLKLAAIAAGIPLGLFLIYRLSLITVPFIIAFAVSTLMEPLVRFLVKRLRMPRKLAAAITLILVLIISTILLSALAVKLFNEISSFSKMLPTYAANLYDSLDHLIEMGTNIYLGLPDKVVQNIENLIAGLTSSLATLLENIVKNILNTAISLPEAIVFIIVTILSTYFLSGDRDKIYSFFRKQLPASFVDRVVSIKDEMFSALFGYIRAQLILMSVTGTLLYIGLSIIRINHPLIFALLIALIDAFPILGTGGVLIPWSLYSFLIGDTRVGISLIILYIIVLVTRQLIEPKVLGNQIGLHPLVTLLSMYVGLQLMGFVGMIVGPVTVLLTKNILKGFMKGKTFMDLLIRSEDHTSE